MLFPGHFGGPASSASGKEAMQRRMAIDAVPGLSSDYPPFDQSSRLNHSSLLYVGFLPYLKALLGQLSG